VSVITTHAIRGETQKQPLPIIKTMYVMEISDSNIIIIQSGGRASLHSDCNFPCVAKKELLFHSNPFVAIGPAAATKRINTHLAAAAAEEHNASPAADNLSPAKSQGCLLIVCAAAYQKSRLIMPNDIILPGNQHGDAHKERNLCRP
jgi:hypothetical protein